MIERVPEAAAPPLLDSVPDAIFVADPDGRCVEVNDVGCRLIGLPRAAIVGHAAAEFVAPTHAESFAVHLREFAEARSLQFETVLRRADGSTVPVEVHARRLPDGQRYSVIRDISARSQREEDERRDREVLERLRAISALDVGDGPDQAILEAVLDAAIAISDADAGMIQCADPDSGELRCVAARGAPAWLAFWQRVPSTCGACGVALTEGARVVVEDMEASPIFAGEPVLDVHRAAGLRAVQSTPLFSRRGEAIGVVSTHHRAPHRPGDRALGRLDLLARHAADVLAHRLDERRVRQAQTLAAGILEVSADAIIAIDPDHRIVEWNRSAEKMFGYPRTEALGMALDELLPPGQRAIHREHVGAFVAGSSGARRMDHARASGRRRGGEEFPIDATIAHLEVDGARILTVAIRDVTEQRRAEQEQRLLAELGGALASVDYEETLRRVVQVTTARLSDFTSLFLIDDPARELRRAAAASRDPALAWAIETVMDIPLSARLTHPALVAFRDRRSVVLDIEPTQYPSIALDPDHLRALTASGVRCVLLTPLVATASCLGVLVMSRCQGRFDEQDVRLAEAMARRCALHIENASLYRAEQRATRARDEVLQIVAHDLRNPLNAINLQLQRLMRQRPEPTAPWPDAAVRLRDSGARMNELIQDLLDVTRLEAGALSMTLAPVAPDRILEELVESQQPLVTAAGVELRREAAAGLPDVRADHRRLLQAFQNLLANALRFSPEGSSITVGAVADGGGVEFRVADTGAGIAPEHLAHVFDRFWQGDRNDRRGAGLGLAIVRGIVEAHGGRVRLESELGRGTTVYVRIPAAA